MLPSNKYYIIFSILASLLKIHGADKYTDENRPYEFQFTIDGEQHRHEKKDENGIIMGEFGFITADGVYHVTVYATDENGNFKILSMKNIRMKPYPATVSTQSSRKGNSLPFPPLQQSTGPQEVPVQQHKQISLEPPGKSCSHCSLPTTSPPAPQFINNQQQQHVQDYNSQNYPQGPSLSQNYPVQSENAQTYPSQNSGQQNYPETQQNQNQQNLFNNQNNQQTFGSQSQYPQNDFETEQQYPSQGMAENQYHGQLGNYNTQQHGQNGNDNSQYDTQNSNDNTQQHEQNENDNTQYSEHNLPSRERNPKQYDGSPQQQFTSQGQQYSPQHGPAEANFGVPHGEQYPSKPTLISAQMQIVDKNTDIYHLDPEEKEGLPNGLTRNDMMQLLYTFNYTVGFHGHHEEGYTNGAKVGYYYVTNRNGIRTRIDYVADEKGFRPKITQEVLDLLSDEVPKPETEKDEKYGLKGYEFKWLYYPADSKKR